MRRFYCADCGKLLNVTRKALPKYATIIDIVEVHECSDEPVKFDLEPIIEPTTVNSGKRKFVQKLNDLNSPTAIASIGSISTEDLRDRRFDLEPKQPRLDTSKNKPSIKSIAPTHLLDMLNSIENSIPDKPIADLESENISDE